MSGEQTSTPTEPTDTNTTQIPVTDGSDAPVVPEPSSPAPTPITVPDTEETHPDVPGSAQTVPTAESQTQTVPEAAPNPVPATAAPATDQVTVNTSFQKVIDDLQNVVVYVNTVLVNHPLASEVISDITSVVEKVTNVLTSV